MQKAMEVSLRYALDYYQAAKSGKPEKMVNYENRIKEIKDRYVNHPELFEEVFLKEQEKRGIFVL